MKRNVALAPSKPTIFDRPLTEAERQARYRQKHPQRAREASAQWKNDMRDRVDSHKADLGCEDCGNDDPRVLDLHHRDGEEKLMDVSNMRKRRGWLTVKAEMEKCRVLCANCHRIEHAESRASGDVTMQVAAAGFYRAS